jgi:hypothetical protein
MKSQLISFAACVFACSATLATANEVMVTNVSSAKDQKNSALAIDIVSDGSVAGFSFRVDIPGLVDSSAKLGGCVAELPKGFQGGCSVVKGSVYVIASSDSASLTLPQGVTKVGTIYYSRRNASKDAGQSIQVVGAEFSDNNANSVSGTAKVLAD